MQHCGHQSQMSDNHLLSCHLLLMLTAKNYANNLTTNRQKYLDFKTNLGKRCCSTLANGSFTDNLCCAEFDEWV